MKWRKANILTLMVIAALMVYACVSLLRLRQKVAEAAETELRLQQELAELESQNAALEYAVENAEDPEVIAGVARDKLGLVMPDEQIFRDGGN